MLDDQIDLFIIHSFQYCKDYANLLSLLDAFEGISFCNHSATPDKNVVDDASMISDEELAARLKSRIIQSQVILVIAGDYLSQSKWMQYELLTAARLHKSIIAIIPDGTKQVSPLVSSYARQIISWDKTQLLSLLGKQAKALA